MERSLIVVESWTWSNCVNLVKPAHLLGLPISSCLIWAQLWWPTLCQRVMAGTTGIKGEVKVVWKVECFANKRDYVLFIKPKQPPFKPKPLGTYTCFPCESIFSTFVFLTITTTLCFIGLVQKTLALWLWHMWWGRQPYLLDVRGY